MYGDLLGYQKTKTVQIYLDALNRLLLLDNDEPFSTNIRSSVRVKQSEKRHFTDPSITCSLLNIKSEDMLIKDLETLQRYGWVGITTNGG